MKINLYPASGYIDAEAIMDKMAADGIRMELIWLPRRAGRTYRGNIERWQQYENKFVSR